MIVVQSPRFFLWIFIALSSSLTTWNVFPYFDLSTAHVFLSEKGPLVQQALWRTCFYFHITGGVVCLSTGLFLFLKPILKKWPLIHIWMGRAYVFTVLYWAGPTGLYMCLFAKGGLAAGLPFTLMGLGWWTFTFLGYRAIRKGNIKQHIVWMTRSYAWALSAVSFRLFQILLFTVGVSDEANYIFSMWLSLFASLITGELAVKLYTSKSKKTWKKITKTLRKHPGFSS